MKNIIFAIFSFALPAVCQPSGPTPIYRVTVTERTVKAINYEYRNGPTLIDFHGTVLMPQAKGEASVDSKTGRTEIDARLENLGDPQQFGREYLTYVLWALTPDGRPHNLGEVVRGHSDKSHLRVTTDDQAFALIVTAEPYSAVRQPSDVVVLENAVRPDTVGRIEQVEAHYELLPRGAYSWQVPEGPAASGPKVSMRKYDELMEIYQAQNAVGIARAADAERFAPNTLAKAQQLLSNAQQLEKNKGTSSRIIQDAREASETAEDARVIAERQQQALKLQMAEHAQAQASAEVARARAEAEQAKQAADQARSEAEQARAQAEAQAPARQQVQAPAPIAPPPPPPQTSPQAQRSALRMQLLEQLNGPLPTRDTPRGLVATISNGGFSGSGLRPSAAAQVARVAALLAVHPGLRIEVEGHTEGDDSEPLSWKRAEAVRQVLVSHGMSPNAVTSRGLGDTHPLTSDATPAGREENQRVEIIVFGDPVGTLPFWDHTYSLSHR
ncbi:MAG TPA: OmpA family protein [Bryobacteraceae bacterium]|nr:OmpA family protein [Bryobacteraceae bacterium]